MGKEIITFDDIEVEKHNFHQYKNPISIYDVNIDRIVLLNKIPFGKKGFKYFIGHKNDDEKVMPLCINLLKMSAYKRHFDQTKYMCFLIKDNKLTKKYNEIWDKVSEIIEKGFDSEPVYHEKCLKTKTYLVKEKSIQIFIVIKCQTKILIVFVYH